MTEKPSISTRDKARRTFFDTYAATGDHRSAARLAGISERTARRWRDSAKAASPSVTGRADLTSFVGREQDIGTVCDLLNRSRLVTIVGAPGIGKTRLAKRVLERVAAFSSTQGSGNRSPTSIETAFCDLRGSTTLPNVAIELSRTLGICLGSDRSELEDWSGLSRALASRGPCILALDNFEQVTASADLSALTAWLQEAPDLRLLITSRRMLRIVGEHLYELGPLPLPQHPSDLQCLSVKLFIERAQTVEPSFTPTNAREATVELVRRTEGIPLAIELAAGQLIHATPQQLIEKIIARQLQLSLPREDVEPRHATLHAAVDGSWQLLKPWDQSAWAQLSVFHGGITPVAAAAVVNLSAFADAPPTNSVLRTLREASVLRVSQHADELRWDMFEVIREFGARELEPELATKTRHAFYFLEFGEHWVQQIASEQGHRARKALFEELDNLRSAFEYFMIDSDREFSEVFVARIALVIHAAAATRLPGLSAETLGRAIRRMEETDRKREARGDKNDRLHLAKLYLSHAQVARTISNYAAAEESLEKSTHLADGESPITSELDCERGVLLFFRGDLDRALEHLKRAAKAAEEQGLVHLLGRIRRFMGCFAAEGCGEESEALTHLEESQRLFENCGDAHQQYATRVAAASFRVRFQRVQDTRELEQLIAHPESAEDPRQESGAWLGIGWFHHDREELAQARAAYEQARKIAAKSGLRHREASAMMTIATVLDEQGDLVRASHLFERATNLFELLGEPKSAAHAELLHAGCTAGRGDFARAFRLLERADRFFAAFPTHPWAAVMELQRAYVELLVCRASSEESEHKTLAAHETARSEWNRWRAEPEEGAAGRLPRILRDHLSARIVWRRLGRALAESEVVSPSFWVAEDGRAFRVSSGPIVELPRRSTMRRVIVALAQVREESPGRALSVQQLVEKGWPDERILSKAAAARVHVMVSRLRQLGLETVLCTSDEGYLFDPSTPFHFGGEPPRDESS